MRIPLSEKDIKELRYQCRMGYIIPLLIFMIGNLFMVFLYALNPNYTNYLNYTYIIVFEISISIISLLFSYLMNRKYWADIKNNEKLIEPKTIQNKECKKDFEAGSGTMFIGQEMNEFDAYSIIVDNVKYRVDEGFFYNCDIGEEVYFNFGPKSKFLIGISLKKGGYNNTYI